MTLKYKVMLLHIMFNKSIHVWRSGTMYIGKFWGDKNSKKRPLLALHGWLDNAGSFDKLIEHMNIDRPVLAIDFPGHGWSSPPYRSTVFHLIDFVLVVRRIQENYKWEKITFMSHSLGAAISFLYATLYPEYVDIIIGLDAFKPLTEDSDRFLNQLRKRIDKLIEISMNTSPQKSWTPDTIRDRWIHNSRNSLTQETAKILMNRGIKETSQGRFVYSCDNRMRVGPLQLFDSDVSLRLAKNIRCHLLLINFSKSGFFNKCTFKCPDIIDILKENAKSFDFVTLEGKHHLHMSSPELVSPIIDQYLKNK